MGLDMFFYARKRTYDSYSRWDKKRNENEPDLTNYPKDLTKMAEYIFQRNFKSVDTKIYYQVGYFRKFNALHAYIVNRYADGEDVCQEIELNKDDIKEIKSICERVLEDPSKAKELLPTQDGFFFGDTSYDDYYFDDVKDAVELFTLMLEIPEDYSIIYRASW